MADKRHSLGIGTLPKTDSTLFSEDSAMNCTFECEREDDGRWLAEVVELAGVLAYGNSADEAMAKAEVLALRVLAERIEHGEARPIEINFALPAAA